MIQYEMNQSQTNGKRIGLVVSRDFDQVLKEVAAKNNIQNKSLMIRHILQTYISNEHPELVSAE
ncbi:MAG: hypothetical protein CMI57_02230 [Parcubacteria group bacterium]|nr:hypothetical protein [Parcubacteria group bacterium]|tara:strand:+ start:987 stop:1178 length:192 start_codon:yes stop_codon:yes gene_type:complete